MDDGRLNILTRGTRPFRLVERQDDLPYPAGTVEFLGDRAEEPDEAAGARRARRLRRARARGDRQRARPRARSRRCPPTSWRRPSSSGSRPSRACSSCARRTRACGSSRGCMRAAHKRLELVDRAAGPRALERQGPLRLRRAAALRQTVRRRPPRTQAASLRIDAGQVRRVVAEAEGPGRRHDDVGVDRVRTRRQPHALRRRRRDRRRRGSRPSAAADRAARVAVAVALARVPSPLGTSVQVGARDRAAALHAEEVRRRPAARARSRARPRRRQRPQAPQRTQRASRATPRRQRATRAGHRRRRSRAAPLSTRGTNSGTSSDATDSGARPATGRGAPVRWIRGSPIGSSRRRGRRAGRSP